MPAGPGAISVLGRNTPAAAHTNNFDLALYKDLNIHCKARTIGLVAKFIF
jgi:hypothetical protein